MIVSRGVAQVAFRPIAAAAAALEAEGRVRAALETIEGGLLTPELTAEDQAHLLLRAAQYDRVLGQFAAARAKLDRVEGLLGESVEQRFLRCNLFDRRAHLLLSEGLFDRAIPWMDAEWALLEELESEGHRVGPARALARMRRAHLALAREDYADLDRIIAEGEESGEHDAVDLALLRARGAYGWNERERDAPPARSRAREILVEQVLAEPLPDLERVLPELVLAEIAVREIEWEEAQHWLDEARVHMGTGEPVDRPQYALWVAYSVRLALEQEADDAVLARWSAEIETAFAGFIERWSAVPVRSGGHGILHTFEHRALFSEAVRLSLHRHGPEQGAARALELLIRLQALHSWTRSQPAAPADARAALAGFLGEQHCAIAFVPAPLRTHAFLLCAESVQHFELAAEDRIHRDRRAAVRLQQQLGGADRAAVREALRDRLLPPALRRALAPFASWTVVGEDLLGEVPFEALPWEDGFVGTRIAVDRIPSLPIAVELSRRAPTPLDRQGEAWLLCRPTPDSQRLEELGISFDPTALDGIDTAEMLRAYGSKRAICWSGPEARLSRLRSERALRCRVLQFLTHGVQDPDREMSAGLVLTPDSLLADGLLWADFAGRLAAPAVVLITACRLGIAPVRRGDAATADMAGFFLSRGSQAVCLSPYDLETRATALLSGRFHSALDAGHGPAEAMRQARDFLARQAGFEDPFYHASLRVVGLGQRPVFAVDASPAYLTLALPCLFIAGALLVGLLARRTLRPSPRRTP